ERLAAARRRGERFEASWSQAVAAALLSAERAERDEWVKALSATVDSWATRKGAVVDRGHEEDESVHELLLRHVGDVSGLAGYLPGNVRVLPRPPGHILPYPRPALSSLRDTVCGLLPSRDARLPGRANWHSRSLRWNLRRGR